MVEKPNDTESDSSDSVEEMMQHLEEAKKNNSSSRQNRSNVTSELQAKVRSSRNAAVLASNFESRLEEIEENDAVTHRSSKPWKSAKVGVEAHGRLPIYYRLDSDVTHKGYIFHIVLNPDENTEEAEELARHISEDDTYSDHSDKLDTTTYIVTEGERLDEPFPQTELKKISGDGNIEGGYSRQPAYVHQRPDDFPDFP
jgi:hypothetical protein